jgi:hypothetical protein
MSSVAQVFAGLTRTPVLADDGTISWQWQKGLTSLTQAASAPAGTSNAPASSSAAGAFGNMATDGQFLYIATGPNKWKRIALTAF